MMKAAVIGAGAMGCGIAEVFGMCSTVEEVFLCDLSSELMQKGLSRIAESLH